MEFFSNVILSIFGGNPWVATIIVSMFPIIELKGAIPLGVSVEFWGEYALTTTQALFCSLLGSCLVVPILALVFRPIIKFMKGTKVFNRIAIFVEDKVAKATNKIQKNVTEKSGQKKTLLKMLGVFAFVAIPLPLTGVWTGTCIGVALGLSFFQTVFSVVIGNIVAGFLITFVCEVFPQITSVLFLSVLLIVALIVVVMLVKMSSGNKTKNNMSADSESE